MNSFFLDLRNSLTINKITLNDKELSYSHSNNKINIILDKNYIAGETVSVKVYYEGLPGNSGFGSFCFNAPQKNKVIYTLSEPYGA